MNSADNEIGALLGELEGSGSAGTTENAGQRLPVEETASPSVGVNGEESEDEPGELRWSKARHKIRVAATKYSEDTHADY